MEERELLFVRPSSGLSRTIGSWTVMFFPICASIGTWQSWALCNLANMYPGANIVLTFAIGGVFILLEGICSALLMTMMPRSGGNYVAISRGVGGFFGSMEFARNLLTQGIVAGTGWYFTGSNIGAGLVVAGKAVKNVAMVSVGNAILASPWNIFGVGVLLGVTVYVVALVGPRITGWWFAVLALIGLGSLVISNAVMASTTNLNQAWDSVWGVGAYDEVISLANAGGFKPAPFSWDQTLLAMVFPITMTFPYCVIPWAGEVSEPSKNMVLSGLGSAIVLVTLFSTSAILFTQVYGQFGVMYNYVVASGLGANFKINPTLPMTHIGTFAASVTTNPFLGVYSVTGVLAPSVGQLSMDIGWCSRTLFSASMDKLAPEIFSRVTRWGTPIYGIIYHEILAVLAGLMIPFGLVVTAIVSFLLTFAVLRWMWTWIYVTAPITRLELYNASVRKQPTVMGISLMQLCGLPLFFIFTYLVFSWASITPVFSMVMIAGLYTFGVLWYMLWSHNMRKRGLDPDKAFAVLPPP